MSLSGLAGPRACDPKISSLAIPYRSQMWARRSWSTSTPGMIGMISGYPAVGSGRVHARGVDPRIFGGDLLGRHSGGQAIQDHADWHAGSGDNGPAVQHPRVGGDQLRLVSDHDSSVPRRSLEREAIVRARAVIARTGSAVRSAGWDLAACGVEPGRRCDGSPVVLGSAFTADQFVAELPEWPPFAPGLEFPELPAVGGFRAPGIGRRAGQRGEGLPARQLDAPIV